MKVSFAGGSHLVYEFYHDCCSCGICNLVGPGGEEFVRKPLPWAGAFVNSPGISISYFERTPKRKISPAFVFLYVSVKSKLQHAPPPAYPGHWTPLPFRGGGNLIVPLWPIGYEERA